MPNPGTAICVESDKAATMSALPISTPTEKELSKNSPTREAAGAVKLVVGYKALKVSRQARISLNAVPDASAKVTSCVDGGVAVGVALPPALAGKATCPIVVLVAIKVTVAVSPKFNAGDTRILSRSASIPVPLAVKLPVIGSVPAVFKGAIIFFTAVTA